MLSDKLDVAVMTGGEDNDAAELTAADEAVTDAVPGLLKVNRPTRDDEALPLDVGSLEEYDETELARDGAGCFVVGNCLERADALSRASPAARFFLVSSDPSLASASMAAPRSRRLPSIWLSTPGRSLKLLIFCGVLTVGSTSTCSIGKQPPV